MLCCKFKRRPWRKYQFPQSIDPLTSESWLGRGHDCRVTREDGRAGRDGGAEPDVGWEALDTQGCDPETNTHIPGRERRSQPSDRHGDRGTEKFAADIHTASAGSWALTADQVFLLSSCWLLPGGAALNRKGKFLPHLKGIPSFSPFTIPQE